MERIKEIDKTIEYLKELADIAPKMEMTNLPEAPNMPIIQLKAEQLKRFRANYDILVTIVCSLLDVEKEKLCLLDLMGALQRQKSLSQEITTYLIGEVEKMKSNALDKFADGNHYDTYCDALDDVIEMLKGEK